MKASKTASKLLLADKGLVPLDSSPRALVASGEWLKTPTGDLVLFVELIPGPDPLIVVRPV